MRSDLTQACAKCWRRVPRVGPCPDCGGETIEPKVLPPAAPGPSNADVRGLLLGAPALLGFAASLVLSAVMFITELDLPLGPTAVALAPMAWIGGALGIGIFFALAWLPWALLVFVGVTVVRPSRWLRPRLQAAERGPSWRPTVVPWRVRRWFERALALVAARRWWVLAALVALWWALQLIALLVGSPEWFQSRDALDAIKTIGSVALIELVGLGLVAVPAAATGHALAWSYAAVSDGWFALKQTSLRPSRPGRVDRKWREGRSTVEGRILVRRSVVAPVSGEPCAAFRLFGTADDVVIDDGACGALDVECGDRIVTLRAGVVAVALAVASRPLVVEGEARERVRAFMTERGLTLSGTVRAREAALHDGDRVIVTGAPAKDRDPEGGYRGADRDVLGDGDGHPLLIERVDRL